MNLKECRHKIDNIDKELFELLSQRFKIVKNVVDYKIENNLEIYQKNREEEVFLKVESLCKNNNLNVEFGVELITLIMDESKKLQKKMLKLSHKE